MRDDKYEEGLLQTGGVTEEFTPNESITVCYTLNCEAYKNSGQWFNYGPNHQGSYNPLKSFDWHGLTVYPDGLDHSGACRNASSYNQDTDTFYEGGKASKIDSIRISQESTGQKGRYYAAWGSDDVNGTGYYRHYGYATLDDNAKPNHS